ncbi:MAG TPA: sigma-70 family RNA polymerase sigma factor [Planctomycetota bacterium]|nr:sigma-70 family RNA polymerase sigma factor [Planctomycetota bacterium]
MPPPRDTEHRIRQHLTGVWRYLRMHGANPHEADDLTQEAFVIALQKHALGLDAAATATFLRRTARFLFLRLRRDHREAVLLADAVDALWNRDCAEHDGDEMLAALRQCVEQLQGHARTAVELSYGLGAFDPTRRTDVAAALGLLPNGVKTLMQRVRQQLRGCVERRQRATRSTP